LLVHLTCLRIAVANPRHTSCRSNFGAEGPFLCGAVPKSVCPCAVPSQPRATPQLRNVWCPRPLAVQDLAPNQTGKIKQAWKKFSACLNARSSLHFKIVQEILLGDSPSELVKLAKKCRL